MLKMVGAGKRPGGQTIKVVVLGLSRVNVERLQAGQPIIVRGDEIGLDEADIVLFAGETEASMAREMEELVGPATRVKMDPRTTDA